MIYERKLARNLLHKRNILKKKRKTQHTSLELEKNKSFINFTGFALLRPSKKLSTHAFVSR